MQKYRIIDSHLHIWDPDLLRYPWLETLPALKRRFSIDDYRKATLPYHIEQMVFVQCQCEESQALDEVKWVTHVAHQEPRITGIVAWAPLEAGIDAAPLLKILSDNSLVKGVRCPIQHAKDPQTFGRSPALIAGIRLLADLDFSLDLCIHHTQVAIAIEIARACQDVRIIIDHLGKPDIRRQTLQPWMNEISMLAALPNVWCKISGAVTEADFATWAPADLRPFLLHAVASFGPDRVLFGGDWPVLTQASTFPEWLDVLLDLLEGMPASDLTKLLSENARIVYRL